MLSTPLWVNKTFSQSSNSYKVQPLSNHPNKIDLGLKHYLINLRVVGIKHEREVAFLRRIARFNDFGK